MNPKASNPRLARLQRECEVALVPALTLSAACAVLFLVLGMDALLGNAAPVQAGPATQVADNERGR